MTCQCPTGMLTVRDQNMIMRTIPIIRTTMMLFRTSKQSLTGRQLARMTTLSLLSRPRPSRYIWRACESAAFEKIFALYCGSSACWYESFSCSPTATFRIFPPILVKVNSGELLRLLLSKPKLWLPSPVNNYVNTWLLGNPTTSWS